MWERLYPVPFGNLREDALTNSIFFSNRTTKVCVPPTLDLSGSKPNKNKENYRPPPRDFEGYTTYF